MIQLMWVDPSDLQHSVMIIYVDQSQDPGYIRESRYHHRSYEEGGGINN